MQSCKLDGVNEKRMEPLKDAFGRNDRIHVVLETIAEANIPYKERIRLANERAAALAAFLSTECRVAPSQIRKNIAAKAAGRPAVKMVLTSCAGKWIETACRSSSYGSGWQPGELGQLG